MRINHGDFDRGIALDRFADLARDAVPGRLLQRTGSLLGEPGHRPGVQHDDDAARCHGGQPERSGALRDAGIREAGVDVLDVLECDLVLAHLRVPELV